jgi:uncharacterized protein involved in propanediol utilization
VNRNPSDKTSLIEPVAPLELLPGNLYVHPKIGYGSADAHHGELLQGVIEDTTGRLHRMLVSLPCGIFRSEATFMPDRTGKVRVEPEWKVKAHRAVELALGYSNKTSWGGLLKISSNIPLKWGLGSSTSDVTAAIRATVNAFGKRLDPREIAHLAVRAETASDSIMFSERTVLFAHREGIIIEDFYGPLPEFAVLGFNTDNSGTGIDTLSFPPVRYSRSQIDLFQPLVRLFRLAIRTQNLSLIGQVASASAHINQRYLPKPHFDRLKAIVQSVGASGFQVAHSGTVVGIIFDPKDPEKENRIQRTKALIAELGICRTWCFETGEIPSKVEVS